MRLCDDLNDQAVRHGVDDYDIRVGLSPLRDPCRRRRVAQIVKSPRGRAVYVNFIGEPMRTRSPATIPNGAFLPVFVFLQARFVSGHC